MSHRSLTTGRALALAGLIGLTAAGCGRRGPLEAPPTAANAIALPDADIGADPDAFSQTQQAAPFGQPARRSQGFTVPESRFALDPLL